MGYKVIYIEDYYYHNLGNGNSIEYKWPYFPSVVSGLYERIYGQEKKPYSKSLLKVVSTQQRVSPPNGICK
jgi:hypothetical protein